MAMQSLILLKVAVFCRGPSVGGFFVDRWRFLEHSMDQVRTSGDWCEFGVFQGESLRFIAAHTPRPVHGFDAFEGLPDSWAGLERGAFSTGGRLPELPPNAVLHVGWFDATVPEYVRTKRPGPIAFAHIDCDLYESAVTVLRQIGPFLVPGTVLIFDELVGVFHNDEYSALVRELLDKHVRIEWVGFYLYPKWGVSACLRVVSGLT
jgi:hypothetical protein